MERTQTPPKRARRFRGRVLCGMCVRIYGAAGAFFLCGIRSFQPGARAAVRALVQGGPAEALFPAGGRPPACPPEGCAHAVRRLPRRSRAGCRRRAASAGNAGCSAASGRTRNSVKPASKKPSSSRPPVLTGTAAASLFFRGEAQGGQRRSPSRERKRPAKARPSGVAAGGSRKRAGRRAGASAPRRAAAWGVAERAGTQAQQTTNSPPRKPPHPFAFAKQRGKRFACAPGGVAPASAIQRANSRKVHQYQPPHSEARRHRIQ